MNLLVSYAHMSKSPGDMRKWRELIELWSAKDLPVMIDSGAFSVVKSGATIDHQAYMTLVSKLSQGSPSVEYIQLDKPRDDAGTRTNLQKEYAAGLKSIPVQVANAGVDQFVELVEKFNPRVCVAGGQMSDPEQFVAKTKVFHAASGNKSSIHALGFTRGFYPLSSAAYSFDSTSWLAALKWGVLNYYDPVKGIGVLDYSKAKKISLAAFPRTVRNSLMFSGVTETDFRGAHGGRTHRSLTSFFSADAWLRFAKRYEKAGKRFYFAAVKPWMVTQLILAAKYQGHIGLDWKAVKKDMPALMDTTFKGETDLKLVERHLDAAIKRWKESQ